MGYLAGIKVTSWSGVLSLYFSRVYGKFIPYAGVMTVSVVFLEQIIQPFGS